MRKFCALFAVLFCLALPSRLFADLSAIHTNELPQETAILAALDDAQKLEPFSSRWVPKWDYSIPKSEVAQRLSKDLTFLILATKSHPDNSALQLLTGLVAHYAYNLDVDGSYDAALSALAAAEKLSPSDIRAPWFRAAFLCGTDRPAPGADEFLKIESNHPISELPVAFWSDYVECASVTNMPAHVLRAADHLRKMHAPASEFQSFLADTAQKRFVTFDPEKSYKAEEAWEGTKVGDDVILTSTMCGIRIRVHGVWAIDRLDVEKSSCVAYFSTGPYKALTQGLRPSVLVLIQRPKEGESLSDFSKKFLRDGTFESDGSLHCPAPDCVALKGLQPGMYKADGDGHGRVLFFERDEPEFPGLTFESPDPPSPEAGASGLSFYRPEPIKQRIPGKLDYVVLLDTAASIEGPALKDFEFFLQNLTVE